MPQDIWPDQPLTGHLITSQRLLTFQHRKISGWPAAHTQPIPLSLFLVILAGENIYCVHGCMCVVD